jgi:hypothetical protein
MDSELSVRLKAFDLTANTLIVAEVTRWMTDAQARRLVEQLQRAVHSTGLEFPVAVLAEGVRIEALDDAALAKLGLMRIPTDGEPTKEDRRPVAGARQRL